MLKKDKEATRAAKFKDWRSYVALDGREVLYGGDWNWRVDELDDRCKGQCQGIVNNERCKRSAMHPHHIIKRSHKRDDRLTNLLALCQFCHIAQHPEKQPRWREYDAYKGN